MQRAITVPISAQKHRSAICFNFFLTKAVDALSNHEQMLRWMYVLACMHSAHACENLGQGVLQLNPRLIMNVLQNSRNLFLSRSTPWHDSESEIHARLNIFHLRACSQFLHIFVSLYEGVPLALQWSSQSAKPIWRDLDGENRRQKDEIPIEV